MSFNVKLRPIDLIFILVSAFILFGFIIDEAFLWGAYIVVLFMLGVFLYFLFRGGK